MDLYAWKSQVDLSNLSEEDAYAIIGAVQMIFKQYDKEKNGKLNHDEVKMFLNDMMGRDPKDKDEVVLPETTRELF